MVREVRALPGAAGGKASVIPNRSGTLKVFVAFFSLFLFTLRFTFLELLAMVTAEDKEHKEHEKNEHYRIHKSVHIHSL